MAPERKEGYLEHIRSLARAGHPAVLVSLCDKLHNGRAIVADVTDPDGPGDEVWSRFSASAEETAWYYRALSDVFSEAAELPARGVREFAATVDALGARAEAAGEG